MANNKNTRSIKPYKLTGFIGVDTVAGCIDHCARHHRTIKEISLNHNYWRLFTEGVKRLDESYVIENDLVNFDDVVVKKGSILQTKRLTYELWPIMTVN